jgi:hypothetical protein
MFSMYKNVKKVISCDPNNTLEVLDLMEKYAANFHLFSSNSTEDYMLRKIPIKRVLITFFLNLSVLICGLRFTIIALFDTTFVKIYFADFTYMFTKPVAVALMGSLFLGLSFAGN